MPLCLKLSTMTLWIMSVMLKAGYIVFMLTNHWHAQANVLSLHLFLFPYLLLLLSTEDTGIKRRIFHSPPQLITRLNRSGYYSASCCLQKEMVFIILSLLTALVCHQTHTHNPARPIILKRTLYHCLYCLKAIKRAMLSTLGIWYLHIPLHKHFGGEKCIYTWCLVPLGQPWRI